MGDDYEVVCGNEDVLYDDITIMTDIVNNVKGITEEQEDLLKDLLMKMEYALYG